MGKNTGEGQRKGAVVGRVQHYNPRTDMYVKFDTENHKIMSCSKNPYKGVRNGDKHKQNKSDTQAEPKIDAKI